MDSSIIEKNIDTMNSGALLGAVEMESVGGNAGFYKSRFPCAGVECYYNEMPLLPATEVAGFFPQKPKVSGKSKKTCVFLGFEHFFRNLPLMR